MLEQIPQSAAIPDSDYVIFGGTGDLALRKIFPALFWRYIDGQIGKNFRLIATSRKPIDVSEFSEKLKPFCQDALSTTANADTLWQEFIQLVTIQIVDIASGDGAEEMAGFLTQGASKDRPLIFYLAVAPALFGPSCQLLEKVGLALPQSRLVVEKPLGHDYASAEKISQEVRSVFSEDQIYRIDHYLGKETVQNLMALRFANVIFESQWNNNAIDHVQITVAETVGVGQRGSYYDESGALRDMVQNHILQLVCLVGMEPPSHFDANQVRDEKLRVLKALRPLQAEDIMRGQYQEYEGEIGGRSDTETYVALKLGIENWRWAGVPFYVRTGKKLAMRASEIVITFKRKPHDIFANGKQANAKDDLPNRLVIRLQPQEGLRLQLISKEPGPGGMRLFPSELNLSFDNTFEARLPDAYERLLMDTARGNQTLFMRHDEVLAAWAFVDPVIALARQTPPSLYRAGTFGPEDSFFDDGNDSWLNPREDES
jgi:glucose-6-phosphate 1-dehydrogenase